MPENEPRITTFEKRWAMPDRKNLVSKFWLLSSLVLLALVVIAPIRTSRFATAASRPDGHRRNLGLPAGHPTARLHAATDADVDLLRNDLSSESEEQDWVETLDEPRVSFIIPCSFRTDSDRRLAAARSLLSLHPLRC